MSSAMDGELVEVIENTKGARDQFGYGCACTVTIVSKADVRALLEGKCWAYNDGEYSHFVMLGIEDKEGEKKEP